MLPLPAIAPQDLGPRECERSPADWWSDASHGTPLVWTAVGSPREQRHGGGRWHGPWEGLRRWSPSPRRSAVSGLTSTASGGLSHTRLAHMARGRLDRPAQTHLARVLAAAPGREDAVTRRRRRASLVVLAETRARPAGPASRSAPGGTARGTPPGSGLVLSATCPWRPRRAIACRRQWPRGGARIPRGGRGLSPVGPPWRGPWPWWRRPSGPKCRVGGVVEAGSLAAAGVQVLARRRQEGSRRLTPHRGVAPARVHRREAHGGPLQRPGPPMAVDALVPLLPATASRPVTVREPTAGGVTLAVRLPGVDQGRSVVRVAPASWTGRSVVRVTQRLDGRAATLIRRSWPRWPTATFAPDRTGPVGGQASRRRSAEALGHHG